MGYSSHAKIECLESLRGLAALAVVLSHLRLAFWWGIQNSSSPPLMELWHNGDFAVRLFFVLSGFVLSRSYFVTWDVGVVRSAAIRRYFRLAIPCAASVLVAYSLCMMGYMANHTLAELVPTAPNPWLNSFYITPPHLWAALREAFFGAYFDFHYTSSLNVVLWTLNVELQGSFLVFAMLALMDHLRYRFLLYGILIFLLDALQAPYLVDFVVGLAICDWYSRRIYTGPEPAWVLLFGIGLFLADLRTEWLTSIGSDAFVRGARFWPTLAAMCLVIGSLQSKTVNRILSLRPFLILGSLSFSLYLFHLPLLCSVGAGSYCLLKDSSFGHEMSSLLASAMFLIVALATAKLGSLVLDPAAQVVGRWVEHLLVDRFHAERHEAAVARARRAGIVNASQTGAFHLN